MKTQMATALLAVAFVVGCSSDDTSGSSSNGGGGGMPACDDVWVDGNTLPKDYEGCLNGNTIEAAVTRDCKDGTKFTTYQDHFYAVLDDTIHANMGETAADPAYKTAYNKCLG